MKFKNITKKVMPFNVKGEWVNIGPGDIIELGRNANTVKGLELIIEEKEKVDDKIDLSKMNKDQLNDYGAKIGFDEVNTSMTKKEMVKAIEEFQNEEN